MVNRHRGKQLSLKRPFGTQERPDYVYCAKIGQVNTPSGRSHSETWCGVKDPKGWTFDNAGHALATGFTSSANMLCHGCSVAIRAALKAVSYGPKRRTPGSRVDEDDDE